jgi:hypothetical protein
MKVLLLHPEDDLPRTPGKMWDVVVDLGRAPRSLYERWRQHCGCEVLSLYDFAEEIEDLYRIRTLLQLGSGQLVDAEGIDWWNVLSLELVPELLRLSLAQRLSRRLGAACELRVSRPDVVASALAFMGGSRLRIPGGTARTWPCKITHYSQLLTKLDRHQLTQVLEDKLHLNGLGRRPPAGRNRSGGPVILLPSAYSNASHTAVKFAGQLPDRKFLLVYTRTSGRLSPLPPNVTEGPLSMHSAPRSGEELAQLLDRWQDLKSLLMSRAEEYAVANAVGVLHKMPSLLRWGIWHRDAWEGVFTANDIAGCLCTDDSNPPTRIPLEMAQARGLPAVACHHGALDYFMALKTTPAEFYIAKSELERDYLQRVCRLPGEKIAGGKSEVKESSRRATESKLCNKRWLVFLSEPYATWYWRSDAVYSELLPHLSRLAEALKLELVFKIHPFESVREHRRRLRRCLPQRASEIQVIAGPPTPGLWEKTQVALTVQSTTALQCAELGIPVFLCGWLRDPHSGYQEQFIRFGVGEVLESVEKIAEIPMRLRDQTDRTSCVRPIWSPIATERLEGLFSGTRAMATASSG